MSKLDIHQFASAYLDKLNPTDFDLLMEALWDERMDLEAAFLLITTIISEQWKEQKSFPDDRLKNFLNGLCEAFPVNTLFFLCEIFTQDYFFQKFNRFSPQDRKIIAIFYALFMLYYSGSIHSATLWEYTDDETLNSIGDNWIKVINRLKNGHTVHLALEGEMNFRKISDLQKEVEDALPHVIQRGLEKYSGMNSFALKTKLERRLLDTWHEIKAVNYWSKDQEKKLDQFRSIIDIFLNDHQKYYHSTLQELGMTLHQPIKLLEKYRESIITRQDFQSRYPVELSALSSELELLFIDYGVPSTVTQMAIASLTKKPENEIPYSVSSQEEWENRLSIDFTTCLLTNLNLRLSLPQSVVWINQHLLETKNDWQKLLLISIRGFIENQADDQILQNYLELDLPHLAGEIYSKNEMSQEESLAQDAEGELQKSIQTQVNNLKDFGKEIDPRIFEWLSQKRYPLVFHSLQTAINDAEKERNKFISTKQIELERLFSDSTKLLKELPNRNLSKVTLDELEGALQLVNSIYLNKDINSADAAQKILDEIKHFYNYPGASTSGILNAIDELQTKLMNKTLSPPVSIEGLVGKESGLKRYIDAFRSGELKTIGLPKEDILSVQQRTERAALLELWQSLSEIETVTSEHADKDMDKIKTFCSLFSKLTQMYAGEISSRTANRTHYFTRNSIPHYETKFYKPYATALKRNVALVFVSDDLGATSNNVQRKLDELERFVRQEPWMAQGDFIVLLAMRAGDKLEKWAFRQFPRQPVLVIGINRFLEIITSYGNPYATGTFRRMLLNVAGPNRFDVFKFNQHVDQEVEIFVGRRELIDTLVNGRGNYAIYGGRRIGKSSLLLAVKKALKRNGVNTIMVSLEGQSEYEVMIYNEILQKLKIRGFCDNVADFRLKMENYLTHSTSSVVILFDEMDKYITARMEDGKPHDLIRNLRALSEENSTKFRIITAGFIDLWRNLKKRTESGRDNPYYNFLDDSQGALTVLDSSDAQTIVKQGFQEILGFEIFDSEIPRMIVEYTTGHPAFVQKFCERLHRRLSDRLETVITVDELEVVFKEHGENSFLGFVSGTLVQNLDALSRLAVYLIALETRPKMGKEFSSADKLAFSIEDIRKLARSYDEAFASIADNLWEESINELIVTSVIKNSDEPGKYEFSVPAYLDILREYDEANRDNIFQLIKEITLRIANGSE